MWLFHYSTDPFWVTHGLAQEVQVKSQMWLTFIIDILVVDHNQGDLTGPFQMHALDSTFDPCANLTV